ncbi:hypothetical protein C1H46_037102 [Malus baccata]|uniref:F-box domain-containing protein n=1 Tax=Malus baccata TaxID=106549 RepID=A0A540KT29_MALBA|nr:hypothetical protein C1H46_037102 [Malus baccata]
MEQQTVVENKPNLPTEIISDILSRLPAKLLCRFKCVSKTWISLITDPSFAQVHYKKVCENDEVLSQRRRVALVDPGLNSIYSFDLDEFLVRNDDGRDFLLVSEEEMECVYRSDSLENFVMLVSACKGLLFFALRNLEMYLLNPAIRQSKKIPTPPEFGVGVCSKYLFGFGFDDNADDYKVVFGRCFEDGIDFGVHGVKTGAWRVIEGRFPYRRIFNDDSKGTLLNGGFHWLTRRTGGQTPTIMSFRLEEEEVREIQMPRDFVEEDFTYYSLGAFRGCLCVSLWTLQDVGQHEFWVMKEYGVRESWTRIKLSLTMIDSGNIMPTPYRKNDHDMLFAKWVSELCLYNFNDHSFLTLPIPQFHELRDAEVYLESVVSPN